MPPPCGRLHPYFLPRLAGRVAATVTPQQGHCVLFTEPLPLVCGHREGPGPGPKTRGEAGPRGLQGGPPGECHHKAPPSWVQMREETPPAVTCRDSPLHTVTPWGRASVAPSSQFWGRGSRGVVERLVCGSREEPLGGRNARCGGRGALPLVMGQPPAPHQALPWSTAGAMRPPLLGSQGQGLVGHPVPGRYSWTPCASPHHLSAQHPQKHKAGPSLGWDAP